MEKDLISTIEAAKILGVSRVTIFNRIRKGEIEARKVGRNYVIDRRSLGEIYQDITPAAETHINKAVDKAVKEYGDVLKRLGKE